MKIKSTLITSLCLFQVFFLFSQNQKVADSTISTVSHLTDDTLRIRKIIHFANDTYLNNPSLCKIYVTEAMKQSIEFNYQLGIGDSYVLNGIVEADLGHYNLSEESYFKALEIYRKINNALGIVNVYNNLGLVYSNSGLFVDALDFYIKGLKIFENYENKNLLALLYTNLGKLYLDIKDYDRAIEYLKKSEEICISENSKGSLIYVYNMLGNISMNRKDHNKANKYYNKAMQIAQSKNNMIMVSSLYRNIAEIYSYNNDDSNALIYYNRSYKLAKNLNNSICIIRALNALGHFYYIKKSYDKSIMYLHESNSLSNKVGFKEGAKNSALHLSFVYKALNNYALAYDWRVSHEAIHDDMYSNEMFKSITGLFTKLENERREYEGKLNEQRNKIKSLIISLIASALLILFAALFLIQKKITKKALSKHDLLNRELTSKAIFLVRKNEMFSKIENILNEKKDHFIMENQATIQSVINEAKSAQNEEAWTELEIYFNKVHIDFHKNLIENFPKLSVNDRRLSILLRMNMTTKDISSITQQTGHTIDIARSRLRKKLGIVNTKTSLYTFLTKY